MTEPNTTNTSTGHLTDCPEFLTGYMRYIEIFQNRTDATVRTVYLTLREFLQFIHFRNKEGMLPPTADAHKDMSICNMQLSEVAEFSRDDMLQYLCFLDVNARNTAGTIRRKISQIRVFYQYLLMQRQELGIRISEDPTNNITGPATPIRPSTLNILAHGDIQKLLDTIAGEHAVRDYAIILLILTAGLTVSEVVSLNLDCYGKGRIITEDDDPRSIALTPSCIDALDRYIREYRAPLLEDLKLRALFVSSRKRRITVRRTQQIIESHLKAAGLSEKGYSAKNLRDTAIAEVLRAAPEDAQGRVMEYFGFKTTRADVRFQHLKKPKYDERVAAIVKESGINQFG